MKVIAKFTLTALAGLMLVACGSGGGNGGSSDNKSTADAKPIVKPSTTAKTETKPAVKPSTNDKSEAKPSKNETGGAYVVSYSDQKKNVEHKVLTNADNLNLIVVDGKELRVAYQDKGIYASNWANVGSSASCCGKFSSVKFGVIQSQNENEKDYVFYNGKPTQDMPASGKASYAGHFIISGNIPQLEDKDYFRGDAKFDVDFGSKKLTGALSQSNLKPIKVEAKVSGNAFAGNAGSSDFSTKATVEGKFFGKGAAELGGIFKDEKGSWSGAFGAAK